MDDAYTQRESGRERFAELYREYAPGALRLANSVMRGSPNAGDAVQEAFLRVYRHMDSYSPDRPFKPWLDRIVLIECYRLVSGSSPTVDIDSITEPVAAESDPEAEELRQLIDALPDKYRKLVLLKYLSGYSEAEIAKIVSLPRPTVKSRLFEARQLLKKQIGQED